MTWHRVRGAVGIAIVWAVAWLPLGVLLALYRYCCSGPMTFDAPQPRFLLLRLILYATGLWLLGGALAGLLFAAVLAFAERGRTIADLRLGRTVLWGAFGAAILPTLVLTRAAVGQAYTGWWEGAAVLIGMSAILGAGSAAATLALARAKRGAAPSALTRVAA
jgi:hypothetical protein